MSNLILRNGTIRKRHYVRNATARNHWFDFMASKVSKYRSQYGEEFCFVINGSKTVDDTYIIPYPVARVVFTDAAVDRRGRWVGTVRGSTLTDGRTGQSLDVSSYHNAFPLLNGGAASAVMKSVTVNESADPDAENPAPEPPEALQFALETHLRDFLAKNLDRIELGLRLHERGNHFGVEYPVENGRIDILATDRAGGFVVIELKLSQGRNKTLGQLLYYMSWVDQNLGGPPCRGVIIANDISDDLRVAVSRVPGVSLARYRMSFSVEHLES